MIFSIDEIEKAINKKQLEYNIPDIEISIPISQLDYPKISSLALMKISYLDELSYNYKLEYNGFNNSLYKNIIYNINKLLNIDIAINTNIDTDTNIDAQYLADLFDINIIIFTDNNIKMYTRNYDYLHKYTILLYLSIDYGGDIYYTINVYGSKYNTLMENYKEIYIQYICTPISIKKIPIPISIKKMLPISIKKITIL